MKATELLSQQHAEVEELFEELEEGELEPAQKKKIFTKLADTLAAHATIEEQIFYPETVHEDTEDLLREAVEEHLSVKRVITDLLATRPGDESFDAKIKVLKEQIEHHVEEEEDELFPKVEELFAAQLEEMGARMESLFVETMDGEPRFDIPGETEAAAPIK